MAKDNIIVSFNRTPIILIATAQSPVWKGKSFFVADIIMWIAALYSNVHHETS